MKKVLFYLPFVLFVATVTYIAAIIHTDASKDMDFFYPDIVLVYSALACLYLGYRRLGQSSPNIRYGYVFAVCALLVNSSWFLYWFSEAGKVLTEATPLKFFATVNLLWALLHLVPVYLIATIYFFTTAGWTLFKVVSLFFTYVAYLFLEEKLSSILVSKSGADLPYFNFSLVGVYALEIYLCVMMAVSIINVKRQHEQEARTSAYYDFIVGAVLMLFAGTTACAVVPNLGNSIAGLTQSFAGYKIPLLIFQAVAVTHFVQMFVYGTRLVGRSQQLGQ